MILGTPRRYRMHSIGAKLKDVLVRQSVVCGPRYIIFSTVKSPTTTSTDHPPGQRYPSSLPTQRPQYTIHQLVRFDLTPDAEIEMRTHVKLLLLLRSHLKRLSLSLPFLSLLLLSSSPCWALIPFSIRSSFTSRPVSSFRLPMSGATEGVEFTLIPKETAICFIEYQNEFATEGGKLHDSVKDVMEKTNMLENSKKLADAARKSGCLIVHCPIEYDKVFLT